MAKDNLFDQDINLQGVSKIVNLRFDVLDSISGTPIQTKQGAAYFNTNEKSIRLNIDGTHWFSTVLFNGTPADVNYLAVFTPGTINQIEKLEGPDDGDALVQVSYDGSVSLVEPGTINFLNYLDEAIYVDSVINGDTRLVTSNAVYDYVQAAISSGTGDYLPLAGGTMLGDIIMNGVNLTFKDMGDTYAPINIYTTSAGELGSMFDAHLVVEFSDISSAMKLVNYITGDFLLITDHGIFSDATAVSFCGTSDYPFTRGYINSAYVNTIYGNGISSKLTLIGGSNDTKIELGGDQVTVYDNILPSVNMSKNLGGASMRWQYGYFNYLKGFQLTLSTGQTVIDISNTADIVEPASSSLLTESAIVSLFNTIKTIEGTDITDMSLVGMVTRYSGANPENYVLTAADTWVHKNSLNYWELELISGTTYELKLNDSYDIASFKFFTNSTAVDNNLLFGVRSATTLIQLSYDGNSKLYLGDNGTGLPSANGYYEIEVLNNTRISGSNSIYFGTDAVTKEGKVNLYHTTTSIGGSSYEVLYLDSGIIYPEYGISTDGDNVWEFLFDGSGAPTPDSYVIISINGQTYKLSAELYNIT